MWKGGRERGFRGLLVRDNGFAERKIGSSCCNAGSCAVQGGELVDRDLLCTTFSVGETFPSAHHLPLFLRDSEVGLHCVSHVKSC
jgi:hypothetical protein